jgi:hypothetical protein
VIDQFRAWLGGGVAPEATLDDNIRSVAMVFAAIAASRTDQTVERRRDGRGGATGGDAVLAKG